MQRNKIKIFKRAFKDSLPVMAGYVVMGAGFGVLLRLSGYNFLWSILMGLTMYSGTMQYIAIGLITAQASLLTTAVTALMTGARYLFYGISVVDKYEKITNALKKYYLMYALTDETYSLVCMSDDLDYCFYVSFLNQIYWLTGGIIGSVLGSVLLFNTKGIEFSMTALFITICVDQWYYKKNRTPAIMGFISGAASLIIFGRDNFLIPAMAAIIMIFFLLWRNFIHGLK